MTTAIRSFSPAALFAVILLALLTACSDSPATPQAPTTTAPASPITAASTPAAIPTLTATPALTPEATAVLNQEVSTPAISPTIVSPAPTQTSREGFPIPTKREPPHPKLDSALNQLLSKIESGAITDTEAAAQTPLNREGTVGVTIRLSGDPDQTLALLEAHDITPRHTAEDYIEAFVPLSLLPALSEQDHVLRVDLIIPPLTPALPQQVPGSGAAPHNSSSWHQAGYTGSGIKIGIIDVGYDGAVSLLGTDLPAEPHLRCYTTDSDDTADLTDCDQHNHGTLVAESIIDIAPDATLYLGATRSLGDTASIVDWMITERVSIINMSLTWPFDGPGDGTSPQRHSPLNILTKAVNNGILWVNSAGNDGQSSWFGIPTDKDNDNILEFGSSGEKLNISNSPSPLIQLRWDGDWGSASNDLDLHVLDSNGNIIAQSLNPQNGDASHRPYEFLAPSLDDDAIIQVTTSAETLPRWVQIIVTHSSLAGSTGSASIASPAESNSTGMLTVGATNWHDTQTIAPYSSRGPTPDGRLKPDLVGVDCGETALAGPGSAFCGTSQAAPHIAGLAALVRQRFPELSHYDLKEYLIIHSEDRGLPGPDNTWGAGLVVLPDPFAPLPETLLPQQTEETPAPTANLDRETLEIFYHATGGDNWTKNTYWLSDRPFDEWYGINLSSQSGRVSSISLPTNNLSGTIPPELQNMTALRYIDLSNNDLDGEIPGELGTLPDLVGLTLDSNNLTGEIPPELGNLSTLRSLNLFHNQLTGEIPPELGKLELLSFISFGHNQLTGNIPPEMLDSDHLQGINLPNNQLSGTIPQGLNKLPNLSMLLLDGNNLTGEIPPELGETRKLIYIELHDNQLEGTVPPSLGNLTHLEVLDLSGNNLTGMVPPELGLLPNIRQISLNNNQLTGTIPPQISALGIGLLDLSHNDLHGNIPVALTQAKGIWALYLGNNNLSGDLPSEIADIPHLNELQIQNNNFTGELPQSLITSANLDKLNFLGNAGLCAPTNDEFQEWLKDVSEKGPDCEDDTEE